MRRGNLARRLAFLVSLGFAAIWVLSIFVTGLALRSEQAELFDNELNETAHLFRPIVTQALSSGNLDIESLNKVLQARDIGDPDEVLIYQILHRLDGTLVQSRNFAGAALPDGPVKQGYTHTATHIFYTTDYNASGYAVRIGDPLNERKEAYQDSFLAFLLPMLAMIPLAYLLVGWIARTSLRPLDELRREISDRGETQLDPIDSTGQPTELAAITASLNGFMIRLSQSLEGERAFASSAAHELRTPVAVALAQVQRLRAETTDPGASAAIARVDEALLRMARLVTRLLQMSRAEAGVGISDVVTDIAHTLHHVADDSLRSPARAGRLVLSVPDAPVYSGMDADAFAIVAGNLIDNAFQHGSADGIVTVRLSPDGRLSVMNDGEIVPPAELARLKERLHRGKNARDGFGLGLYITDKIARQVGSALELHSPPDGSQTGFEVRFTAPPA